MTESDRESIQKISADVDEIEARQRDRKRKLRRHRDARFEALCRSIRESLPPELLFDPDLDDARRNEVLTVAFAAMPSSGDEDFGLSAADWSHFLNDVPLWLLHHALVSLMLDEDRPKWRPGIGEIRKRARKIAHGLGLRGGGDRIFAAARVVSGQPKADPVLLLAPPDDPLPKIAPGRFVDVIAPSTPIEAITRVDAELRGHS